MTTEATEQQDKIKVLSPQVITARHSFMVFPEDMNYGGTLFGGKILAEMDRTALKAARRILYETACDSAVTVSLDKVDFKKPAHLGDIIELFAHVKRLGKTSIEIGLHVARENHLGKVETICEATFVFVSLKDGKPFPHRCRLPEQKTDDQIFTINNY